MCTTVSSYAVNVESCFNAAQCDQCDQLQTQDYCGIIALGLGDEYILSNNLNFWLRTIFSPMKIGFLLTPPVSATLGLL